MIQIFYKFGEKQHLEQFQKGVLYCNPLSFFRDIEDDKQRKDSHEGNVMILFPANDPEATITFEIPILDKKITIPGSDCKEVVFYGTNNPSHIFCFSILELEENAPTPNLFQAEAVLLFQSNFVNNITDELNNKNIKYEIVKVKYQEYGDTLEYNKNWGMKHIQYASQNEIRIAIWEQSGDKPFQFNFIPHNISYLVDMNEQDGNIEMKFTDK